MLDRIVRSSSADVHRSAVVATLLLSLGVALAQAGPTIASLTARPTSIDEGDVVAFEVDASHPDDAPIRYAWTFGDGARLEASPRNARVATVYVDEGTYQADVVVEDASGEIASARTSVTVLNVPPEILAVDVESGSTRGSDVRFVARVHDPGDDTLRYAWDFGDGTVVEPTADAGRVDHTYAEAGRYSVRLVVDDGDGGRVQRTFTVDVGDGLRYDLDGDLVLSAVESESGFYAAAPTVHRERGQALFGEEPVCTVHFGGGDTTAPRTPTREPIVSFQGTFPDGLLEGARYPVFTDRNETGVVEPGESIRRLYRSPNRFFVAAAGTAPDGLAVFHGTGGTVVIERADAQRVELRFDVTLERTLTDTEILATGQAHPPGEPLALRGRLEIDLEPESGSRSPSVLARNGAYHLCRPAEAMTVVEVGPVDGPPMPERRDGLVPLIDFDDPTVRIRFSHPVDLERAGENIVLAWRHVDGSLRDVPVDVAAETDETVLVTPLVQLMDGVVYRLTIRGGGGGVLGSDGRILADDEVRHAETVLDLSENRNGIGVAVTQVSRDAPLVPGKPTEIRVYVNWNEKPRVDPAWQTRWAEFDVEVSGAHDDDARAALRRWDLYDQEGLKHARDAVRLFGWRPGSGGNADLTVGVTQVGLGEPRRRFETTWQGRVLAPVAPMTIEYAFVRAGSWRDGVPPEVRARGAQIAFSGATYSEQVFPAPDVTVTPGPDVTVSPAVGPTVQFGGYAWTIGWLFHRQTRESVVAGEFAAQRGGSPGGPDVALLFVPKDVLGTSGQAQTALGANPRVVLVSVSADSPVDYASNTVAHEIGHAYGLDHDSDCLTRDPGVLQSCIDADHRDDVEGTRVAVDGFGGANKSFWSGNADLERTPGYLFSLMHPMAIPSKGTFITRDDYATLLDAIAGAARTAPPGPAALGVATPGPVHVQDVRAPGLRVSGWMSSETGAARIGHVRPTLEPRSDVPDEPGPLGGEATWLEALTPDGRLLARVPVVPQPGERWHPAPGATAWRPFSVSLPVGGPVALDRLRLVTDSRRLDERVASASVPSVTFDVEIVDLQHTSMVAWSAADRDGDALRFDLAYAPDGVDWRPVAIDVDASAVELDAASLRPGDDPRLRVIARDGFHSAIAEVGVRGHPEARAVAALPYQGAVVSPRTSVTVWTMGRPVDLEPDTLRLERVDAPGEPVDGTLQRLPAGDGLRFLPDRPLAPETAYRVTLGPDLGASSGSQAGPLAAWTFSTTPPLPMPEPPARDLSVPPDADARWDEPVSPPDAPSEPSGPRSGPQAERPALCGSLEVDVWGHFVAGADPADARVESSADGCRIEYEAEGSFGNLQSYLFQTPFYYIVVRPSEEQGALTFEVESDADRLEARFTAAFELREGPPHQVVVVVRTD